MQHNKKFKKEVKQKPITIFAIPKPFHGHNGMIQRNAIKSWTLLEPRPEIILFGKEEGIDEIAKELNLRHVPDVKCNEYGTPLLNHIFRDVQSMAKNNIVAYVNSDIILMSDFISAIDKIQLHFANFMMIGQRYNVTVEELIDFSNSFWQDELRKFSYEKGVLHGHAGIDYFVFPKNIWGSLPPFAIGRAIWDQWLVWRALDLKLNVVDVTDMVLAIHQKHDYGHVAGGKEEAFKGLETQINRVYSNGLEQRRLISDANWISYCNNIIFRPTDNFNDINKLYKMWVDILLLQDKGISNILHKLKIRKAAIMGTKDSGLNLFNDLKKEKIEVVSFLDSNVNMLKRKINNVEVNSPAWLTKNKDKVDAVLLSIEGAHDLYIKNKIRELIKNSNIYILSWKDLVVMQRRNEILEC